MITALSPQTDRPAWLAERRKGVGSSDAAAVLGFSPYKTAYEVFLEKTGRLPDAPESEAMRWGTLLEDVIAAAYSERTGEALRPLPLLHSERWPWMLASVDRVTDSGKVVEIKNVGWRMQGEWGEEDTDKVPAHYLIQLMHQLAVTGRERGDLVALIGGQDLRVYSFERNDKLIERMAHAEGEFWRLVETGVQPDPDFAHATTPALLDALHRPGELRVELGSECLVYAEAYTEACQVLKRAECDKAEAKARLIAAMGAAGEGVLPDGTRVLRKMVQRAGYEVQPGEYPRLTVKRPKDKE